MATVSTMNADQLLDWIQTSPLQPLTIDEIATAHSETSLAALQELLETLIGDGRLYSFEFSTPESSKQPQAVRVYWTLSFLEAPASPPPPPPPPAVSTPTSPTTSPVLLKNVSSATPSPNRTLGAKPSGVAPRMGLQRKRPRESASPRANANDDLVSPSKRPCSTGPSSPPSPQSPTGGVTAASPSSPSSPPSPASSGTLEEQIRSLEQQIAQKKHQLHSARAATARSLSLTVSCGTAHTSAALR